ncbi:PilZ domain-containing protein [Maridesulfovibrio zosterae]|uniref:PilZ domain-containing protein n=1 Tax=Maridesulfovibrio zosterae TaxID=82171 RepID=UPI00041DE1DB|nr:PilZ domain-containing protein [Maridesulfovibrio zosterae]
MEKFNFQHYFDQFDILVTKPAQKYIATLPHESMPLILGGAACIALLAAILAFLAMRPSAKKNIPSLKGSQDFSDFFKKSGTIMDISTAENHEKLIGRGVVTQTREDRIRLEIIENTGLSSLAPSAKLLCMFPPEMMGQSKVNAFTSTIQTLECNSEGCGRMTISPPQSFSLIKRRRHKRKRVIDQQFIRVKFWLGTPDSDETAFADAVPDLAVNSYDPRSTGHEDNQVINISNGGIGVSAHQGLIDKKFNINDDILINIFMFNFRQKVFKPYWYAGKIRTIEEMDGTSYRLGVEFTMTGKIRDETEQNIDWSNI